MADNLNILDSNFLSALGLPVAQVTNERTFLQAGATGAPTTNGALGNQNLRLSPMLVPNLLTISQLGAEITVAGEAGSVLRLGVYTNTRNAGRPYPGSLLAEGATQVDGTSATVQEVVLTGNLTLQPGLYWCGGVVQAAPTTQPTVRIISLAGILGLVSTGAPSAAGQLLGYSQSAVSGALPATFTSTLSSIGASPRLHFRLA